MMKSKKSIADILFKDEELKGEEDVLTEEEIEGYSACSENQEKCAVDCGSTFVLPAISPLN